MSASKSVRIRVWKFFAMALAGLLIVAVLLYVFFGTRPHEAEAQVVNFYPETCLGGWSNPLHVVGEPEVLQIGDRYNEENSAVYTDNQASLYCGSYRGSIPAETKHTEVVLRFSWTQNVTDESIDYPQLISSVEDISTTTENSSEGSQMSASSSESSLVESVVDEIIEMISSDSVPAEPDAPTSAPQSEPIPTPEPDPQEPVEETPSVSDPEPEVAPASEEPVSFLDFFFTTAHAQEMVEETVPEAQFRVEFTLDGATWSTLGYVSDVSNDIKLTFPKDAFLHVEDISRVQIGLVPLLQIDTAPQPVYLDAMWLEVEYAPAIQPALHNAIEYTPEVYAFSELSFVAASSSAVVASSTASSTPVHEAHILPETVVRMHGIDKRFVLVHTKPEENIYRLWLFDLVTQEATVIADDVITIGSHKGGVKDKMVFWYSATKDKVYAYDLRTAGTYHELLVVQNLPEQSESVVYEFPFTTWKLVDGPEEFYFRSDETGEIFSDGVADGVAQFVLTFELYKTWSKEDLESLGLAGL